MANLYVSDDLRKYRLIAADGEIGSINDIFFESEGWRIRYLLVDTGKWLNSRKILISPIAIGMIHEQDKSIDIELTKWQLASSPALADSKNITRQYEERYFRHFSWTPYWQAAESDRYAVPAFMGKSSHTGSATWGHDHRNNLHSELEIKAFNIESRDNKAGNVGVVKQLVIDSYYWMVRYLLADTRDWLPSDSVLLSPDWIYDVDWAGNHVSVDLDRDVIRSAPSYDQVKNITRDDERALFR
ncbi:MAG: PRC-barrel domain-containing protein, partial [Gammaproteobacteria bacterium]